MSSRALRLSLVGLAFLFAVTGLAGQRLCDITSSDRIVIVSNQRNDGRVSYVTAPRFECDDGTSIQADSSVHFEATSFSQLFGNVVFRDARQELHADRAQYFERVGRLQAQGSVLLLNLEDGSTLTGEDLVLLQEGDDRAEDDVIMRGGRPHASLVAALSDSTDVSPDASEQQNSEDAMPYEVDADLIHTVGDRLFQARGRVEVSRETLQSYGDSLEFQKDVGWLTLFENARILSQDSVSGDTLDVRGDTITMNLPDDQIDEIVARGRAQLLANDVDMRGSVIRLAFKEEELERVFAVQRTVEEAPHEAQPQALAEDFLLTGDSIEAEIVEGELERVFAAGTARGISSARDSLNTEATDELIRSDWIEGDTIIATFRSDSVDVHDPGPGGELGQPVELGQLVELGQPVEFGQPVDFVEQPERQLDLLIALGNARTFYRSAPDSAAAAGAVEPPPLELHYVSGDEVRLFMKDGEVDRMEVVNPTGVRLEPTNRSAPLPGTTVPDTTGTPRLPGADDLPPPVDERPPRGNRARANGGVR